MRHRVDHRKLGRTRAHRKAMLSNMVTSLFDKERIMTTDAKAKEARRVAERLITRAKKGYAAHKEHESLKEAGKEAEAQQARGVALAHWRQAGRVVRKRAVLKKLFEEIAPQYLERAGGYTRILHMGSRPGDNAKSVLLELVDSEVAARKAARVGKGAAAAATPEDAETVTTGKPAKKAKKKSAKKADAEAAKKPADAASPEQEASAAPEAAEPEAAEAEEKSDKKKKKKK